MVSFIKYNIDNAFNVPLTKGALDSLHQGESVKLKRNESIEKGNIVSGTNSQGSTLISNQFTSQTKPQQNEHMNLGDSYEKVLNRL